MEKKYKIICIIAIVVIFLVSIGLIIYFSVNKPENIKKVSLDHNELSNKLSKNNLQHSLIDDRLPLFHIKNILTSEECDQLVQIGKDVKFTRSPVVTSRGNATNKSRTSKTAFLKQGQNKLVKKIEDMASKLTNLPRENVEGLQIVRYFPGEFYKPHYDYFTPEGKHELLKGGQRIFTIFLYLSDVNDGGHTNFPNLGKKVQSKKGDAAFWRNCDNNGVPNKLALHEGTPPKNGITKYGCNVWIRQDKFKI